MEGLEKIRKELTRWSFGAYYYQKENYYNSERKVGFGAVLDSFLRSCSKMEEGLAKSFWAMAPPPVGDAQPYSFQDLKDMSDDFDRYLLIKDTMHGRLFVDHEFKASIKTWDFFVQCGWSYSDHPARFGNELEILTGEDRHSCLMKLKGFCFQYILALVYDEIPTKFLEEVLHSDEKFGWDDRMKVATQLASLFSWLHEKRFTFGSVKPSGIMIDKDFNIKVFDFGFLAPLDEDNGVPMSYPLFPDAPEARRGIRTLKSDVYVFGVLLVELIANKKKIPSPQHEWIQQKLGGGKESIVDTSLLGESDELAISITEIAVKCLSEDPNARPDMEKVSDDLSKLVGATRMKEDQ